MRANQFFVDNEVVKKIDGEPTYDKFAIASTLFDTSFKGSKCNLIEGRILKNCEACNLEPICKGIDNLVENYIEATSTVKQSFTFE